MAAIEGVIKGIQLLNDSKALNGSGAEKTCLVTADYPAYDASADTATLLAVGVAITAARRDGKTATLRASHGIGPGIDDAGNDIFQGTTTVSTDDLTFSLTAVDRTTEVADFTTAAGVSCIVTYTES